MATYDDLVIEIHNNSGVGFSEATDRMLAYVNALSKADFSEVLLDIGAIPQKISPSSSEEKLYSKTTDIVLSRSFSELGLKSEVLEARGNSADISATSLHHGYSWWQILKQCAFPERQKIRRILKLVH